MALTGLKIKLDRYEYSRFEDSRRVVRARIVPEPATGLDETVTVKLVRKGGGPELDSREVHFSGEAKRGQVVSFDLEDCTDDEGYPVALRGDYQVLAQAVGAEASADLRISLVTVDELKNGYCHGLTFYASETLTAKRQPRVVTGVQVLGASADTRPGAQILEYSPADESSPATLQRGGGAEVELDESMDEETLPDERGAYIDVRIDHFELPETAAQEALIIEMKVMGDEEIRQEIDRATEEVEEQWLKVFLEPYRVATEPFFSEPEEGEWFDRRVDPAHYYKDAFNLNAKAWHIQLPLSQLLNVWQLKGFIGNQVALEVIQGKYATNRVQGTVDVMPYDSEYSVLYQFHMLFRLWGDRKYIANFWRYKGRSGLERTTGDVIRAVAYTAALPILSVAGQAYRAGFASESISKDGVSKSVSYTSSATYGIYSATIDEFKKWLKENRKSMRRKYRGIAMTVL